MKKHLLFFSSLLTLNGFGQGFSTSFTNWNNPNGGKLTGGVTYGFNLTSGLAVASDNTGSQTWGYMDMNGDNKPDLVVFAQAQGTLVSCFSPGLNAYWNVYLNNGTGFSQTATQWDIPGGGKSANGNIYGYNAASGVASTNDVAGSQNWTMMDMDGDRKPDLVVTAALQNGKVLGFNPGPGQYWQVFKNTGTGFATPAINWTLPDGGKRTNNDVVGFDFTGGTAAINEVSGSQSWSLIDMDKDNRPDLVVTAQIQGGVSSCFSPGAGQYWKVYTNNGSGFSTTPVNWNLPNGGRLSGGTTYGFNSATGFASASDNPGSQTWSLVDMDGDHQPDLVVSGQLQNGLVTCFGPGNGPYWKVYLNNGSSFNNTTALNFNLPLGGKLSGGSTFGYNNISGIASTSDNTGSQTWSLVDFDNDAKPDLVVTAQLQNNQVTCFSPGASPYWKVFANKGNTFTSSSVNWNLPNGGKLNAGITYGYDDVAGIAYSGQNTGSQSWILTDLDGDYWIDLLVTAQLQGGNVTAFSPGAGSYWKVFKGDGVLGIHEAAQTSLKDIHVYPNPSNGKVTVRGNVKETLTLSNELGQQIQSIELNQENNYTETINGLKTGIYFLSTKNGCAKLAVTN